MPQGPDSLAAPTTSVDPLLLAIVCAIFLIGAVIPFAAAILSSMRDDRAARRAALEAQQITNPVADNVVVAVGVVELEPIGLDTLSAAANDHHRDSVSGGTG